MTTNRVVLAAGGALLLGGVCWLMPPFRLVPLHRAQMAQAQAAFNPASVAAAFWAERLPSALETAPEAALVLETLGREPAAAAKRFGRTPGLGDTVYYLMRGKGRVVSAGGNAVGVALHGDEADLLLRTGLLFGNTVRDATGLLLPGGFPNSQDFNALSTELNRLVETRVIPGLKTNAAVGRTLRFVVAAELEGDFERPLKVVPLRVEWE